MTLDECPYDGTLIDVEPLVSGSMLLVCSVCGAQWEQRGARVRRVGEPDRHAVIEAREANHA